MAGVTAIQGVDDTLKKLTTDAVAGLTEKPDVTVGPLDRDSDALRRNWFLYGIAPNLAYRNMEPPRNGWRSSRGRPPLAESEPGLLGGADHVEDQQGPHAVVAEALPHLGEVEGGQPPGMAEPLLFAGGRGRHPATVSFFCQGQVKIVYRPRPDSEG